MEEYYRKRPTDGLDGDLQDKLNAKVIDLRMVLNQKKADEPASSYDLRTFLRAKQPQSRPQINVIMGGSLPCGNSVRTVILSPTGDNLPTMAPKATD